MDRKQKPPKNITLLPAPEFITAVQNRKVQLIDIRTPPEYDAKHIRGAINIDLSCFDSFIEAFEKIEKTRPLYLYCETGRKTEKVVKLFSKMGFESICHLERGIKGI
ncbi:rhodanese-like domain-containing protein [Maribacter sp. ACAM166]|uniref:rhodanese-like domain-containing protein n=1 Tax=Maribacter sp. ACAM166 TaxID=2508996 RepID=UPI001485A172|nr:rhodanese-like domain-containing protein [Maribacter sp. ACAM166]